MKNINFLLYLIFSLSFSFPSFADSNRDLKKAQQALSKGNYDKAFQLFSRTEQASQHPLAQFSLAIMYQQGLGRPEDMALACQWYGKAAFAKIPTAAHAYAECFQQGIGQQPDFVQAARWYESAAEIGSYISYCSLGRLYMEGKGVKKSAEKALALCQLAANKGTVQAILQLGRWRLEGDEKIKNLGLALQWFKQGSDLKIAEAEYYLGKMMGRGYIKDATVSDARYWFERAASQGYRLAYVPTAELYFNAQLDPATELPTATNLAKAYLWFSVAKQRLSQADQLLSIEQLKKIEAVMPSTWKVDLDPKIAAHLAKYK